MYTGEYLVDAWSAIEEAGLTYIRHNQHSNFEEDEYVGTGDEEPVDDIRLPSTFVPSPAWSAANISDCLALRKALGPVTLFITFTTNPRWPESTSELKPGQFANDRPDLVARVFQQYLSALMQGPRPSPLSEARSSPRTHGHWLEEYSTDSGRD